MNETWITDWIPSERFPMYTRSNVGEIMPHPCSPLGWDLVWVDGVAPGWMNGCLRWGSSAEDEKGMLCCGLPGAITSLHDNQATDEL